MAKKEFTGKDRRLLEKSLELLAAINARDARALDPTPTQSLSTRTLIFDGDESDPTTLAGAAKVVADRLTVCFATPSAAPAALKFNDTFTDTPNKDLRSHVPNTGGNWLASTGQAKISQSGSGAVAYTPTAANTIFTVNYGGAADGQVDLYFHTPHDFGHGIYLGPIVRASGANDWISGRLEFVAGGMYRLNFWQANGVTIAQLGIPGATFSILADSAYRLNLALAGPHMVLTLWKAAVVVSSLVTTSAVLQTNKGLGIWWYSGDNTNNPACVVNQLTKKD